MPTSALRRAAHEELPCAEATDSTEATGRLCPLDLTPLRPVLTSTPGEVASAVLRARRAQEAWRATPLARRAEQLRVAAKAMLARRHEAIELVRAEIGKVDAEALFNETLGPLDTVNAWIRVVEQHGGREPVRLNPVGFPHKSAWIDR